MHFFTFTLWRYTNLSTSIKHKNFFRYFRIFLKFLCFHSGVFMRKWKIWKHIKTGWWKSSFSQQDHTKTPPPISTKLGAGVASAGVDASTGQTHKQGKKSHCLAHLWFSWYLVEGCSTGQHLCIVTTCTVLKAWNWRGDEEPEDQINGMNASSPCCWLVHIFGQ